MKERLWRFEYDDPEWSIIVPASTIATVSLSFLPMPARQIDLGEWEIKTASHARADEDAS